MGAHIGLQRVQGDMQARNMAAVAQSSSIRPGQGVQLVIAPPRPMLQHTEFPCDAAPRTVGSFALHFRSASARTASEFSVSVEIDGIVNNSSESRSTDGCPVFGGEFLYLVQQVRVLQMYMTIEERGIQRRCAAIAQGCLAELLQRSSCSIRTSEATRRCVMQVQ